MGERYDVVVIGGGPGGYVAAIRAGQLGLRAAVVDRGTWGGTCLHWGCIPSKALIHASRRVEEIAAAGKIGIRAGAPEIDLPKIVAWKDGIVARLAGGVRALLKSHRVDAIVGEATLAGADRVRVVGEGGERTIDARAVIVATGARPIPLPGLPFDGRRVVGAREALSFAAVPSRLLVVGGGAIGLELGTVWARFGAKVTVVELLPQVLPGTDPEIVQVVARHLRRRGIDVLTGSRVVGADARDDGLRVEVERTGGERRAIEADVALVSIGMRPDTTGLGLEGAGVAVGAGGFVPVDERLRTDVRGVYAIGDLTGPPLLAHRASAQGEVAAEAIAGRDAAYDGSVVPAAVFVEPEVATVGLSEAQAAERGEAVRVGRFPFAALGRAVVDGETDGFVKVVAGPDGRVCGVHIVGPNASDLIGEAALAVRAGLHAEDIARTIHAHPTRPEALREAARAVGEGAIHAPRGSGSGS
jgi:dihydrolipoamide dehydrogenase